MNRHGHLPALHECTGDLGEGSLVILHKGDRPEIIGRITYTQRSGVCVVDLSRSSRADNGYRRVEAGDIVHPCWIRPCNPAAPDHRPAAHATGVDSGDTMGREGAR